MFNKVILIGRVTKDIEMRYTQTNIAVISFTLAVNRAYSKDGEKNADFINCVAWRKQAENTYKYVGKGSMICVEGRLETRDYMDEKNNVRRYVTEVVCDSITFLDSKKSDQAHKELPKEEELPKGNFNKPPLDDLPF